MRASSVACVLWLATGLPSGAAAQANDPGTPDSAHGTAPTPAPAAMTPTLSGYLQPRFQAVGDSAVFLVRRARVAVDGYITPWAFYRVQADLRTSGAAATPTLSPLTLSATDLFIRLSHRRWSGTVGQFRVPCSLEALLSTTALETTERSLVVSGAAPKRDIGVQLEWRDPDRVTRRSGGGERRWAESLDQPRQSDGLVWTPRRDPAPGMGRGRRRRGVSR